MGEPANIQHLTHSEIDKIKWDNCIDKANNGLIYAYSFYLDHMARHWDGLMLNNYEIVMPLVWNKKYGIHYLYQPFFTAQLGVIGNNITSEIVDAFLSSIPSHFKFLDIALHENNITHAFLPFTKKRVNIMLNLNKNYSTIYNEYHRLATRMIRMANEEAISVEINADINKSISFYKEHYNHTLKIDSLPYNKIINIFNIASEKNKLLSIAAKKNDELLAVYLLLQDQHFVYSILGGSSPEGKKKGAFYLLTDHVIKISSETNRLFRFEGSDIAGIAEFNLRFGGTIVHYNHIKLNRLPFLLKWLKR